MLDNKLKKSSLGIIIAILLVTAGWISNSFALEGKAGEVISSKEDLKSLQDKGLLTEAQVISYTELIEVFGQKIKIVETTDRRMEVGTSKSFQEITKKFAGMAKIAADGNLENYGGAGMPFPNLTPDDPQAGIKAAWNYDLRHTGDDFNEVGWIYPLTDSKGNIKVLSGDWLRVLYDRRTDLDPKPQLPGGEGIWFKELVIFSKPFASKGLSQLTIKYTDFTKERDVYVYVPGLRREARVGAGNRCDCLGGFVFNQDDSNAWTGDTAKQKWTLLEVKDHLVNSLAVWDDKNGTEDVYVKGAHECLPRLERRKIWKIEQIPNDPNYCYSKRIFYLDPQSWWFVWQEMYDRSGVLWKSLNQQYTIFKNKDQAGGGNIIINTAGGATDYKIWEAGPYYHKEIHLNENLDPNTFSLDAMRRMGR